MPLTAERGVRIFPVDSEHSAIFQSLEGQRRQKDQKDTSDGFRRTFQRGYGAAAQRSDTEAGPETSKLEHGKEDNHRFGDHDE